MPSLTFQNLSEEKKRRILNAAKTEFSEKPISKASISSIIQRAGISRGSYYQYFDNLEGIYNYMLLDIWKFYREKMTQYIEVRDGNLIQGFIDFSNYFIKRVFEDKSYRLYENVYVHFGLQMRDRDRLNVQAVEGGDQLDDLGRQDLLEIIDRDLFVPLNDEEVLEIVHYLVLMLNQTIVESFWHKRERDEILPVLSKRVYWLYEGIQAKDEQAEEEVND